MHTGAQSRCAPNVWRGAAQRFTPGYLGHQTVVDFARPVFTISFSESVIDNSYETELKLCGLGHAAGLNWYLKVMKESYTYSFVPWFFSKS